MQFVPVDQQKAHTFYTRINEGDAFSESPFIANFYMAAYAAKDSTGGWLTLSPDSGTVAKGQKRSLQLTANGPKVTPPDQSVNLIIHSNDPANPESTVGVFVHIDQAPMLTNHDTLFVHEADTLNSLIPSADDGNGKITVKLITIDKAASVLNKDSASYFIYEPGYNDAGLHTFTISLSDVNGNKRIDSLLVLVINTNRAPIAVNPLKKRTISLDGPALTISLDSVFKDPDGDAVSYAYAGEASPIAQVFVKPTGETGIIQKDTGRISLPFVATDSYGASGYDTLQLYIKINKAPISTGIPYVFVEKGFTQILELSDYFSDPDLGDVLSYSAVVDSAQYASVEISGTDLIIHGLSIGECIVTVTADDGNGGTVTKSFIVEVVNKMADSGYDYHIRIAPNPIHSLATAIFLMDKEKYVEIQLVNMDGRVRKLLYQGERPAGFNTIPLNFGGIPRGNYYVKFTLGTDIRVVQIAKW